MGASKGRIYETRDIIRLRTMLCKEGCHLVRLNQVVPDYMGTWIVNICDFPKQLNGNSFTFDNFEDARSLFNSFSQREGGL